MTATADLGGLIVHLCVESCIGLDEAWNGCEMRDHKVTDDLMSDGTVNPRLLLFILTVTRK